MEAASPIQNFMSHIDAMRSLIGFMMVLPSTFPHIMTLLTEEQRRAIFEPCVLPWIEFNRTLYGDPSMYVDPPAPIAVDPNCPPLQLSDHIKERLGKCHPFFDFVHAPLTYPLDTQVSLVCVNYCWDAYDTFVKNVVSAVLQSHPQHPNVKAYRDELNRLRNANSSFGTEKQLAILDLSVTDEHLKKFLAEAEPSWSPAHAKSILTLAKILRSVFAHHFGRPDDRLRDFLREHHFEAVRISDDHFEVLIPLVRDIATVVQGQALIIERRRAETYA
jgi:hypothetical protein